MLDAMEQLMEGGTNFDPVFYPKLEECWNRISPSLKMAQVSQNIMLHIVMTCV